MLAPELKLNLKNLLVLTESGFRPFVGVSLMQKSAKTLTFTFDNNQSITVTHNHKFMWRIYGHLVEIHAELLQIGDSVCTGDPDFDATILDIVAGDDQDVYDLIEVGDNKYLTNGILSHNCEFLSSDPLLIDSTVLAKLSEGLREPIREDMGFKFYQQLAPGKTYILGIDPATGSGEDFTTMVLYDFQNLTLVAEFRSNTMSSSVAYAHLKLMLNKISSLKSTCFFSIENNGVGEGIIALYENDETLPERAEFVSEEGANRLGMRTESRVKLRTCLALKQLVENQKLKVWSRTFHDELNNYTTNKGSYAAQIGATDDLISATLIVVRILEEMSTYDQLAFDTFHHYKNVGEFEEWDFGDENDDDEYDDNFVPDAFV